MTTRRVTMRLYFDQFWTEPANGKRLEKQENNLTEVRYFQGPRVSTLQSKMTTYSFERAFNLEEEETSRKSLVSIDCSTKHFRFPMSLRKL